jgi:cytidylate kinase
LIARILESMARTPPSPEGWSGAAILPSNIRPDYESLIEKVVRETANEGNVVIVAHGASISLGDLTSVLRVLVTASPTVRAERLVREAKLDEQAARKAIDESDHQRREYLRRFYKIRQELPTHYDLVVNTDSLASPLAARLIVGAANG